MHQRRGPDGQLGSAPPEMPLGQPVQLRVEQREKLIGRLGVSELCALEQCRKLGIGAGVGG